MNVRRLVFCFGAADPEREAMIKIVHRRRAGKIVLATVGGIPVHPGNAYNADPIAELQPGDFLILVECEPRWLPSGIQVKRIDHHRKGDRGWNEPPSRYWEGSSLGQLATFLEEPSTRHTRALAAMDHCFQAALMDQCPYAPAGLVLKYKIAEIAKGSGVSLRSVRRMIQRHRDRLRSTHTVVIGGREVVDYREYDLGVGWSIGLLTAQVAIALEGRAALFRHRDCQDDPEKITLSGQTTPAVVMAFVRDWVPANRLCRPYWSTARGYAGAYES